MGWGAGGGVGCQGWGWDGWDGVPGFPARGGTGVECWGWGVWGKLNPLAVEEGDLSFCVIQTQYNEQA